MPIDDRNVIRPEHFQRPSGGGGLPPDMSERLARLEGAFDGLKMAIDGLRHTQNITIGAIGIVFAAVIGFGIYTLQRIDSLPADFERLNQTLSSAITAARQAPPQVIVIPSPAAPTPPVTPAPKKN